MAFANIYHAFIFALNKKKTGATLTKKDIDYPTVEMGLEGVKFIEKCLNSSKADSAWVNF